MTYSTDERLKSYLDTNQLRREQMSLAILSLDKRFSRLVARHPRGGPDGGRDIEALFEGKHIAYCAVGFVNQAVDTKDKKKEIKDKFADDLTNALKSDPKPDVFIFLTNMNLSVTEKKTLVHRALKKGLTHCEIFDRERLRTALDSASGLAARFQYLDISLSEAEQRSFFEKWGDGIQALMSNEFRNVNTLLSRMHFFQEAAAPLSAIRVTVMLDKAYSSEELGHARAFCSVWLKEFRHNVSSLLFGAIDDFFDKPGIRRDLYRFRNLQWTRSAADAQVLAPNAGAAALSVASGDRNKYAPTGSFEEMGRTTVRDILFEHNQSTLVRSSPSITLGDLGDAMLLPMLNKSLAEKVRYVHVHANEYTLLSIDRSEFRIDPIPGVPGIPVDLTNEQLADEWVCLRPVYGAVFDLRFSEFTPARWTRPGELSQEHLIDHGKILEAEFKAGSGKSSAAQAGAKPSPPKKQGKQASRAKKAKSGA